MGAIILILVTGATGHIGNVLVHALHQHFPGENLRILVQPNERLDMFDRLSLELFYGDIRDATAVREAVHGARLVFHLAGMIDTSMHPGPRLQEINVGGTRNVVAACEAEQVKRLVYVSSVHALPDLPDSQVITEIDKFPVPGLLGGYAQTKSDATALVYAAISRGLDAVVAFPSGVIGPEDHRLSEMGRVFRYFSSLGKLRLILSFNGAYNFVDVRDVVEGLIAIAEKGRKGEGYILSGHRISLSEIIRLERDCLGQCQPRIVSVPSKIVMGSAYFVAWFAQLFHVRSLVTPYSIAVLQSNSWISHEKASRELGYQPRPIDESFRDNIAWMIKTGMIRIKKVIRRK